MKTLNFTIVLIISLLSISTSMPAKAQAVAVNFSIFQQELSPYGRWVHNPRFGNVWIYNEPGFKPYYTNGHWDYTNYGWTWVSDYDWGWAPFHYGRWEYDPYYGWMWIPGYEWASAWVSWSSYDDYYGWAPLGYGVNINVSFGAIPYNNWYFVPRRNICERNLGLYYVSPRRNSRFRNAVVINNYYYGNAGVGRFVRGPERREVERYTNNRIQERRIDYSNHGRNRSGFNRYDNDRNNNRNNNQVNRNNNNRNNAERQMDDRRNNTGSGNNFENRHRQQRTDRSDNRIDAGEQRRNRQIESNGNNNNRREQNREFRRESNVDRQRQMRTPSPQRQQPAFERRQAERRPDIRSFDNNRRSNSADQHARKQKGKRGND